MPKILWDIAFAANDYARKRVIKGSTQLENNRLKKMQFKSLQSAMDDLRGLAHLNQPFIVEDILFYKFKQTIKFTTKYSLGNCHELACLALYYILTQFKNENIRAEIYDVVGGDHAVLVIGRKENSDPLDPTTWGDDALICDPWSNHVFKASDYLTELKCYSRITMPGRYIHKSIDFDPSIHTLLPHGGYNTTYLRSKNTVDTLVKNFTIKSNKIIKIIEKYQTQIDLEVERLKDKYGIEDQKTRILFTKAKELQHRIKYIQSTIHSVNSNISTDYNEVNLTLSTKLKDLYIESIEAMHFTQSALQKLDEYRNKKSIKTKFMMFFHHPCKTRSYINKAVKQSNKQIRRFLSA